MARNVVTSIANSALLAASQEFVAEWAGKSEVIVLGATKAAADEFVRASGNPGLLGVHALTLTQLAASIAGAAMGEANLAPLTRLGAEAVAARAVFGAMQAKKLKYFKPVADMPGFARAVAATLSELRLESIALHDLNNAGKPGADLAHLLTLFNEQIEQRGLADLADVLALATHEVANRGHRFAGLPLILLDAPLDYRAQHEFLDALAARSPAVLIATLAERPENAGQEPISTPLDRVRRFLFAPDAPEGGEVGPDLIFSAPGEALECVEIARRIIVLARNGTPFDRIAILLRDPARYQPLIEDALRRAAIPEYFSRGALRPDPAGRAFLALLACAGEGCTATRFAEYLSLGQVPRLDAAGAPPRPERRFVAAEDELIPAIETALQPEGETETETAGSPAISGSLAAPSNWEKLIVDAAVVGGYDRWARRLRGLENELRQQLEEVQRDDEPSRERIERQLAQLSNLERFALPLIEYLHSLPVSAPWGTWIGNLSELAGMALRRPESVLAALAELAPMSEVGPLELDEVYGVLAERLGNLRQEPARRRYGRVFTGTIEEARGRIFDAVFLPGLAEGVFPKRAFEDPLLLDSRREQVSRRLARQHERDQRERLLLRIAAASANEALTVSYPRINVEQSRPRVPSFYALEVLRAAEGRLPDLQEFEKRAAAACPTRLDWPAPKLAAAAIDDAEYDLAWLRESGNAKGSGRYLLDQNAALADSLRTRWKRWDHRKWRDTDGIVDSDSKTLAALAFHRLRARSYSASALQQFASCPYKFLLYAILQIRAREESVALEHMDPLTRGALFHFVQFEFLARLKSEDLLPFSAWRMEEALAIADAVLDRVASEQAEKLAPAIPRVWDDEIEGIRTDLRGWVRRLASQPEWTPQGFEFSFGMTGRGGARDPASTPYEAVILDGIRLRGSIDLVERHASRAALRITDHKTGKRPPNALVSVGGGAVLQPTLYALAAEQLLGENVETARLFYCTQRGDYAECHVLIGADARQRIKRVLEIVDDAIATGFLPTAPIAGACNLCDYRPICGPYEEQRTRRKPKDRIESLNALRCLP